ncbi:secreted RxLR effector protein 161-like [Rutidosis leptorrhynchoides]|uniref:secreted RxLR effector protein 161-like n=1 Tax=Rutidosis leptorrhynchoides TaxID=125765 RepID=UPI003A98D3D8
MKDMGLVDVILGIRIKRDDNGITITQSHFIEKILKKIKREICSSISTPIHPNVRLLPNAGKVVSQHKYSQAIGCLMYAMTSTRPDISYGVGKLSRFTSKMGTHHWHAVNRVFKYLKQTMNYGITYAAFPFVIEGYSDAIWITNVEDHSSTTG